jgi:hypothetical protein
VVEKRSLRISPERTMYELEMLYKMSQITGGSDSVTEKKRIFSESYEVTVSFIKGTEVTFMGFVICLLEFSKISSAPI